MLHEAYQYSISTLPRSVKHQISQRLQSAQVTEWHQQQFQSMIDFMMSGPDLDGHLLRLGINELDVRRGHDLRKDHKEFADLIEYHGPKA